MPRATEEKPPAKTAAKPRKARTKRPAETTGDIRLTGDRLVVRAAKPAQRHDGLAAREAQGSRLRVRGGADLALQHA